MFADTQERHSLKHHEKSDGTYERNERALDELVYVGGIDNVRPEITAFAKPSHWIDPNNQRYF
ncbi:hypothetical protein [Rhizobium leguminosarum]|uniref:hypothetical protein n=1 Tax=Rhizobium leguminosarum TaxID=384 RepID=UPI00144104BE|nr:hypothetical protein [Rhizobium leguminosarum]MBY5427859.1 hypothetical protein [Rhizobium leguminosarum]NKL87366.1 hypothetical protein [Rhizobium leguminosarum bv. viciae]